MDKLKAWMILHITLLVILVITLIFGFNVIDRWVLSFNSFVLGWGICWIVVIYSFKL